MNAAPKIKINVYAVRVFALSAGRHGAQPEAVATKTANWRTTTSHGNM